MEDVTVNDIGKVLPAKHDRIALIDADTIAFASACSCEFASELLDREHYTDEEYELILNDPGYDEATNSVYSINMDEAIDKCLSKIDKILDLTGCRDFQLHFTAGRESFRYTKVNKTYKANRQVDSQGEKTRTPYGLYAIKQSLCRKYPLKSKIWVECEADDVVWWLGDRYPEKFIVCAVDKDVLAATKERAFNYYERTSYVHPRSGNTISSIDMQFVQAEDPELAWWYQCLTGDSGDGIIGIKGVGPAKARKILKGCNTDEDRWEAIVKAYTDAGRNEIDAILNMRMVRLDQFNPETMELNLFNPNKLN